MPAEKRILPHSDLCTKCGSVWLQLKFCGPGVERICNVEPEHLHVHCNNCGANYLMRPTNP